jgi:GAF domain-containing protein
MATWAIEMLRDVDTIEDVELILRNSVRAAIGADGATVVRREGENCFYTQEDALSPLWQGQRFPLTECISGWSMLHREIVAIPDIRLDDRIPQPAYRPTFVRSLLMVPINIDAPVGAIGVYWSEVHTPTAREIGTVERLAIAAADALKCIGFTTPLVPA